MRNQKDFGREPYIAKLCDVTLGNDTFRTAIWTGEYAQVTVMNILPCSEIGMEMHDDTDQILFVMQGESKVMMGRKSCRMELQQKVCEGEMIIIPACFWHNVMNCGREPLKLASVYAPPNHPKGTVHQRKEDAVD